MPHELPATEWLERHLADKVFPKLDSLCDHPRLGRLVRGGRVLIDGEEYPTLWDSLTRLTDHTRASRFEPRYFCLTHGDMAFGNILLHDDNIKLIDMDCGSAAEPPESDLGKLFQSLIVRYEQWAGLDGSLVTFEGSQVVSCPAAIYQPDPRTVEILCRALGSHPWRLARPGIREGSVFHGPAPRKDDSLPDEGGRGPGSIRAGLRSQMAWQTGRGPASSLAEWDMVYGHAV